MTVKPAEKQKRGVFFGTAAFFVFVLLFGGLGPHAPFLSGLIESVGFVLLVALGLFGRRSRSADIDGIAPALFVLLLLTTGIFQLLPVPSRLWEAVPGREVASIVLDALGASDRRQPLSLAPEDTRLVIESWLPPIAVFFAALFAIREERERLAACVILAAAISAGLGLLQLSLGDGSFFLEPPDILDRYPGLFANYNHQAVFLAVAVALVPAIWRPGGSAVRSWAWWPAPFWALALIGTMITSSRAGLALFVLSSFAAGARLVAMRQSARRRMFADRRSMVLLIVAVVAVVGIGGVLATGGYRAELMSARFGTVGDDARFEFWTTTLEAIRAFFPYGSGFGTFEPVYQSVEPLEHVREYVVNHAHNDYLELILEAGAAGVLLLILFALWFGTRLLAIVRRRDGGDRLAWSGATIVALTLLHSLVDYPLRTEAIACVFAFACALMIKAPDDGAARVRVRSSGAQRIAA